jgi:hypothetical protein
MKVQSRQRLQRQKPTPSELVPIWKERAPSQLFWPRPLIFLHIPKAAGSTVQKMVMQHYPGALSYIFTGDTAQWLEFPKMSEDDRASLDVILGHVHYGIHEHLPDPATYITMLRDPVDRVVSHYYYVLSNPDHYLHRKIARRGYTLEEFAITRISHELDNDQVRWLTSLHHFDVRVGDVDRSLLEEAKWNLENGIAAVGLLERFHESLTCFERAFGWEDSSMPSPRNVNPDRPPLSEIDPRALAAIREVNHFDVELYEFVEALFEEQLTRLAIH